MNKPISEKEKLLTMLTEINNQLEQLDSILEVSFSNLRISMHSEEHENIFGAVQKLAEMDNVLNNVDLIFTNKIIEANRNQVLKLELGF